MCAALSALERESNAAVIRAGFVADEVPAGPIRRVLEKNGGPLVPRERCWIAFDFDGKKDEGQQAGGRRDVVVDPKTTDPLAMAYELREQLPDVFRDAGCWFQLTSSHGMKAPHPYVWMRMWFHLTEAITDKAAEALMAEMGGRADTCLARPSHLHYVASPIFRGLEDPIPRRSGIIPGPSAPTHLLPERQRRAVAPPTDPVFVEPREALPTEKARLLERVTTSLAVAGNRHFTSMGIAGEMVLHGFTDAEVAETLGAFFQNAGRSPASGELDGVIRYAREKVEKGQWKVQSVLPAAVTLADGPVDSPALDHEASGDAIADELKTAVARGNGAFGKNERLNADILLGEDAVSAPWVYSNGVFHRWEDSRYAPFSSDKAVTAHVFSRVPLSNRICSATAVAFMASIQERWRKRDIVAPCMLPSGDAAPPYVLFRDKILWVDDWLMDPAIAPVPATPDLFNVARGGTAFDATAQCPAWLRFLDSIWGEDPEQIRELQKMFGYLLTPMTKFQKSFWLIGASNGGKGTICEVLAELLGGDLVSSMTWSRFGSEFGPMQLPGRSLCVVDEANETKEHRIPMEAVDFIKSVIGEGRTQINRKGKDFYIGKLPVRFVFSANEFPSVMDSSGAFGRRVQLFVFRRSFASNPDTGLKPRLLAELPGIARWALDGLRMLLVEDGKFFETAAARERWTLLNRRLARVAQGVMLALTTAGPRQRVSLRVVRDVLSRFNKLEGWERADVPVPRLAEQIITQFGTAGHIVKVTQDEETGESWAYGVSWSKMGQVIAKALGEEIALATPAVLL